MKAYTTRLAPATIEKLKKMAARDGVSISEKFRTLVLAADPKDVPHKERRILTSFFIPPEANLRLKALCDKLGGISQANCVEAILEKEFK